MGWESTLDEGVIKAALTRAHEIRQFEIDLYWKRANYFWLLQAAVLTAFGVMLAAEDKAHKIPELLPLALSCLGFVSAFAGWLSARGSKFWQKNWEKHIDCLEDEFEGKLHKSVWVGSRGIAHSVSRVNGDLILSFSFFWFCAIAWLAYAYIWTDLCVTCSSDCKFDPAIALGILILAVTIGTTWRLWSLLTDFGVPWKADTWLERSEVTGN